MKYCLRTQKRGVTTLAFANNHYAGYAQATIETFVEMWNNSGEELTVR